MSEAPSAAALWGRIAMHNKLITQQQWEECVEVYRKGGGKTSIDKILIHKGYLQEKVAEAIRKKVAEMMAKDDGGSAKPAPAAKAPSSPKPPGPGSAPEHAPSPAPGADRPTGHAGEHAVPAAVAAASPAQAQPEEIALESEAPPESEHTKGWRPSDAEWVEAQDPVAVKAGDPAHYDEGFEPIPLAGDDHPAAAQPAAAAPSAAAKSKSKIIIDDFAPLKAVKKSTPKFVYQPTPATDLAKAKAPQPGDLGVAEESGERVECPVAPLDIDPEALDILRQGIKLGASDIHMSAGSPPFYRLHGQLVFTELPKLTPERAQRIVLGFMDDGQQQIFLKRHDLDFALDHPELGRFRVNALQQFRGADVIFRAIASKIPSLEELGLPPTLAKFCDWHQGLVLITGPAGSGKSTTAAALLDLINGSRKDHIITIEDPVEIIHQSKGCNVTQRQVPRDTLTFSTALRGALREDPDVIMIGEMRDLDTVSLAIRAAETGHLVFGTLQTRSAPRTIDRVIDVFPADQQATIRTMLSESLRGVISQQLIPRADGNGRVVAVEVLHCNSAVANLIRDSKTFQLASLMQTGRKAGQKLMDESLMDLLQSGVITRESALKACDNVKYFAKKEDGTGEGEKKGKE